MGAGNALVKSGVTLDTHVQVDTTAPTVSINTSGGTTNQNVQLISGSVDIGDVGATVNIYDNGGADARRDDNRPGRWKLEHRCHAGVGPQFAYRQGYRWSRQCRHQQYGDLRP